MSADTPAIHVENLHRSFGNLTAVNGLSFEIAEGKVVGFVGANGAGKTTTMRILATLDYPTSGRASVQGHNVVLHPQRVRKLLGWVPDHFGTYEHMNVLEYLDFYARALDYKSAERVQRIQDVVDFTDLGPLADRMVNKLSKGQGQRLCLGRALLHDPQVLIMDEPAAGLDPKARVELKRLIRILAEEGKTILISSHILSELGEMCDSLLFIDKGRIVHYGSAEDLKRGEKEVSVFDVKVSSDPQQLCNWCLMASNVKLLEERKEGARIEVDSTKPEIISSVLRRMVQDGHAVLDFHRQERNLEDAFIDMLHRIESGHALPMSLQQPAVAPPPVG